MTNQEAADKLLKFYNSSLGIIGHMKEELGEPIEKAVEALRVVDSLRSELDSIIEDLCKNPLRPCGMEHTILCNKGVVKDEQANS